MTILETLVAIVTLIHTLLCIIEMLFWRNPKIHQRLGFKQDEADKVAPIVANAGLYNGFIAAGLVWGLLSTDHAFVVLCFFLSCVCIAGIFGAFTLRTTTLVIQTIPGLIALAVVLYVNSVFGL